MSFDWPIIQHETLAIQIPTPEEITRFGWIGSSENFRTGVASSSAEKFCRAFSVDTLTFLDQVHSSRILDLECDNEADPADGFFLRKKDGTTCGKKAYGIRTADCLPIYVETSESVLLIHAGWRGLADGILEEGLARLGGQAIQRMFIGPSAKDYEVGLDVIEAFTNPRYTVISEKKYLFDLAGTALAIAKTSSNHRTTTQYSTSPTCTISDNKWHSYRRDKELRGSNLLYFID